MITHFHLMEEQVQLSNEIRWIPLETETGGYIRLKAVLECGSTVTANQALVAFRFNRIITPDESRRAGLAFSSVVGSYSYLTSTSGTSVSDVFVTLPSGCSLMAVGLRTWNAKDSIVLKNLWAELGSNPPGSEVFVTVSVDVEALPARAASDHLRHLIYGEDHGVEYGIRRLCSLFRQHGVCGQFMLDYAECRLYGDAPIFEIGSVIRSEGHDVHLHIHPEILARAEGWSIADSAHPSFSSLDYGDARRALEYGVRKYERNIGKAPFAFRAGAYRFNRETVLAAKSAGIRLLSNYRPWREDSAIQWPCYTTRPYDAFCWDNAILELPVDCSPDPLKGVSCAEFQRILDEAIARKQHKSKTFNLVIHSWSLLDNDESGRNIRYNSLHEEHLSQILSFLGKRGRFSRYADVTDQLQEHTRPYALDRVPSSSDLLATLRSRPAKSALISGECNVCKARVTVRPEGGYLCGHCGWGVPERRACWLLEMVDGNLDARDVVIWRLGTPGGEMNADPPGTHAGTIKTLSPKADSRQLTGIENSSADVFLAFGVFGTIEEPQTVAKEVSRILRSHGLLLVVSPDREEGRSPEYIMTLLEPSFHSFKMSALDPLTNSRGAVLFCTKTT